MKWPLKRGAVRVGPSRRQKWSEEVRSEHTLHLLTAGEEEKLEKCRTFGNLGYSCSHFDS